MHVTAGAVGQLLYLIAGINPFQKKKLHIMSNYREEIKENKHAMCRNNLKTLQLETDELYSDMSNILKLSCITL